MSTFIPCKKVTMKSKAKIKPTVKKVTKKKKVITKSLYPVRRASDVPLTQGMLLEFQKALIMEFRSVNTKIGFMDKRFDSTDLKIDSMDKKFDSIDKRFNSIDKRFESIDKRFDAMDARFESIDKRFDAMDARFESIDKRFDSIDKRFESMDKRFDAMDKRFDSIDMKLDSFIEEMRADRHQTRVLMETQEARNKIVLEGYEQLYFRQDRLEAKVEERLSNIETVVFNKSNNEINK